MKVRSSADTIGFVNDLGRGKQKANIASVRQRLEMAAAQNPHLLERRFADDPTDELFALSSFLIEKVWQNDGRIPGTHDRRNMQPIRIR